MTKLGDAENRTSHTRSVRAYLLFLILTLFFTVSKHAIQFLHVIERKTAFQFAFLYFHSNNYK